MENIINYIKENKKKIILVITTILFVYITYAIFSNKITYIDSLVHSYILSIRKDNLTSLMLTITNIGSAYALITLSILLLIILKNKKTSLYISLNLICSFIISQIAKFIFARPRPIGINLIEESGFSYPSGHSMVSMAFFGFIAYLIYKNNINKLNKIILISILIIMIVSIGFSRIYLGVHYLSDVIGGFLLSIAYLMIYIKYLKLEKK